MKVQTQVTIALATVASIPILLFSIVLLITVLNQPDFTLKESLINTADFFTNKPSKLLKHPLAR